MRCLLLLLTACHLGNSVQVRIANSSLALLQAAVAAADVTNQLRPCPSAPSITVLAAEDATTVANYVLVQPFNDGHTELNVVLANSLSATACDCLTLLTRHSRLLSDYSIPFQPSLTTSADHVMAILAELHWDTVMFLSNARCAVALAQPDTLSALLTAAATHNVRCTMPTQELLN
jgi:hypothetical protein